MSDQFRLIPWRPFRPREPIGGGVKSYPASKIDEYLSNAKRFLGQWYLYGGGHGSSTGIMRVDCSGLVLQAARLSGMNLDGNAAMQQDMGTPVSMSALRPGDLVFHGDPASHVGIYLGNNKVIHAPRTGKQVEIVDLGSYTYFNNARRIFAGNGSTPTAPPSSPGTPSGQPTLRRGAGGAAVRTLQEKLKAHGFDPGPVDGDFGPRTEAAVRAFQQARGLIVDGLVGPQTWGALNKAAPKPKPDPKPAPKPDPKPAPKPPAPTTYVVQPGDTLYKIAQRTLGNGDRWREIFDANRDQIATPNVVFPGQVLRVPTPGGASAPKPAPKPKPKLPGFLDTPVRAHFERLLTWLGQLRTRLTAGKP